MAIKDWYISHKKQGDIIFKAESRKTNNKIAILYFNKQYNFFVEDDEQAITEKEKFFKTKLQALFYAKAYMKKH